MNKQKILESLNDIFINVLGNDEIAITESTTSDDINDWDSLNHIRLIVAIEKFFKIRFTFSEIGLFNNVGDILISLESKELNL